LKISTERRLEKTIEELKMGTEKKVKMGAEKLKL